MRKDEIAFEIAEFIKAGPQAAETQGLDKSTYDRLLLCLADEESLEIALRLAGRKVLEHWISVVRAGGRN